MAGRRGSRRSAGCWGSRHDSPRPSASTGLDALATPYGRADRALRRDPRTFSPRCRRHGEHLVAQFDFYPLPADGADDRLAGRSEEHTSELQSLMRISYAVFCLKKKNKIKTHTASQNQNK